MIICKNVVQSPQKCQWYKKTNNSFHNETYNQTDKMKLIILKDLDSSQSIEVSKIKLK
jgi:hypothetical protein